MNGKHFFPYSSGLSTEQLQRIANVAAFAAFSEMNPAGGPIMTTRTTNVEAQLTVDGRLILEMDLEVAP